MPTIPLLAVILVLQAGPTVDSAGAAFQPRESLFRDPIALSARATGTLEGDSESLAGYLGTSILGGVFLGFVGPFIFHDLGDLGLAAYIASPLVFGALRPTGTAHAPAPQLDPGFESYGPQYQDIYENAYRTRLSKRRRGAAMGGTVVGAMLGFGGFLFWLTNALKD